MSRNYALDIADDGELAEEKLALAYARPLRKSKHPLQPTAKVTTYLRSTRERSEKNLEQEYEQGRRAPAVAVEPFCS